MTDKTPTLSYDEVIEKYVSENEVTEWEILRKEFELLVCSSCGFIAEDIIEHPNCEATLQDWWTLNVRCFEKKAGSRLTSEERT